MLMLQPKETSQHMTFDPAWTSLGVLVEFLFLCSSQSCSHTQKFLPCYYHFLPSLCMAYTEIKKYRSLNEVSNEYIIISKARGVKEELNLVEEFGASL